MMNISCFRVRIYLLKFTSSLFVVVSWDVLQKQAEDDSVVERNREAETWESEHETEKFTSQQFCFCLQLQKQRKLKSEKNVFNINSRAKTPRSGKFMWDLQAQSELGNLSSKPESFLLECMTFPSKQQLKTLFFARAKSFLKKSHECLIIRESQPAPRPRLESDNEGKLRQHKSR